MTGQYYKFFFLCCLFLLGCRDPVIHDIGEPDANQLISILNKSGVEAEKVRQADGKWAVAVPDSQTVTAIKLLEKNRFFKKVNASDSGKTGMLASREERRRSQELTQAAEIERTLGSVSGILEAHVHLNLEAERDPWKPNESSGKNITAAVLLIVDKECDLTAQQVQVLLSGATGIVADNVAVVFSRIDEQESFTGLTAKEPAVAALSQKIAAESSVELPSDSYELFFKNYRQYLFYLSLILLLAGVVINLQRKIRARRAIRGFKSELAGTQ